MGFFYSKYIGGKHFGTNVRVDKHGIRKTMRFRIGRFSCFR